MKQHANEALQLANLIAFIGQYCDTASHSDTVNYMFAVERCARSLDKWDVDLVLDREYDMIIAEFWTVDSSVLKVAFDVDFTEIEREYDLDNLTYEVCNKGLK